MQIFAAPCFSAAKIVSATGVASASVASKAEKGGAAVVSPKEQFLERYSIMTAGALCMASYLSDDAKDLDYLRNYGWELVPVTHKNGVAEPHFLVAMKYFPTLDRHVFVVAFKGSTSVNDWKLNLSTGLVNYGGHDLAAMEQLAQAPLDKNKPAVHKGFNKFVDTVLRQSVLDEKGELQGIFKLAKEDEKVFLMLTGHSLGGAAATLLGERLLDLGIPAEELTVVTFGAPAISNDAFVQQLGQRMELIRVTNPWDPVPGGLQTFFKTYKQFGTNVKYTVPAYLSSMQHPMSIYFDYSVVALWRLIDEQRSKGLLPSQSMSRSSGEAPLVAILGIDPVGLRKHKELPDLQRYVLGEYRRIFPDYQILTLNLDPDKVDYEHLEKLIPANLKPDYYLLFGIDVKRASQQDLYYINLEQNLFAKDGTMLTMSSYSHKVEPAYGNIFTSGLLFLQAKEDLDSKLPFVNKQLWGDVK